MGERARQEPAVLHTHLSAEHSRSRPVCAVDGWRTGAEGGTRPLHRPHHAEVAQRHLLARPQDKRYAHRDHREGQDPGALCLRHRSEREPARVSQQCAQPRIAI